MASGPTKSPTITIIITASIAGTIDAAMPAGSSTTASFAFCSSR